MIRTASTGDLMVVLVFFHEDVERREALLSHLAERFPEITSLVYVINGKCNDTITDQEVLVFKGKDHIIEEMEGFSSKSVRNHSTRLIVDRLTNCTKLPVSSPD